jgi:hypothetical protein
MRAWDYGGRARLLAMPTHLAAAHVQDGSQDFIWIDAGHTEVDVRRDIEAWRPKLWAGGWLLGHDIHYPSVRRAVDALCPGWREIGANMWSLPT